MKLKTNLKGFTTYGMTPGLLGKMDRRLATDLNEIVARRAAEDPTGSTWGTSGFVPVGPDEYAQSLDGRCMHLIVQFNDRICPGPTIKERMGEEIAAITEREGRKPTKSEFGQVRDDALAYLLPRSHIRRTAVTVFVYDNRFVVFTTSAKRASDVAALILSLANDLGLHPKVGTAAAGDSMLAWLTNVATSSDTSVLEATTSAVLRYDSGEKKSTFRVKDKDIGAHDVQSLITDSEYLVSELGVVVLEGAQTPGGLGGVEFTINDKLVIKGIKFPDLTLKSHIGETDGDAAAESRGALTLMALSVPEILAIVFNAVGGEDRTAYEEDDEL